MVHPVSILNMFRENFQFVYLEFFLTIKMMSNAMMDMELKIWVEIAQNPVTYNLSCLQHMLGQ